MKRNRVEAERTDGPGAASDSTNSNTINDLSKEGINMTNRKFSRKRIVQTLGLLILSLALLGGSADYGKAGGEDPPIKMVDVKTDAHGRLVARLPMPGFVQLVIDALKDCSQELHKLLTNVDVLLVLIGRPGTHLNAVEDIASIELFALNLFVKLTRFSWVTIFGFTNVYPSFDVGLGGCMRKKKSHPQTKTIVPPAATSTACGCTITEITIEIRPYPPFTEERSGRVNDTVESNIYITVKTEGTGTLRFRLEPKSRLLELRGGGQGPTAWPSTVQLDPELLIDKFYRDVPSSGGDKEIPCGGTIELMARGLSEFLVREVKEDKVKQGPDHPAVEDLFKRRGFGQWFQAFLRVELMLTITLSDPPCEETRNVRITYRVGPFSIKATQPAGGETEFYIRPAALDVKDLDLEWEVR